ncbi:MAG: type 2 lanthipeptide synthetase LanM family protein [Scytonema sp. PMC 1069.18]|nr:type 2 lanthipeptide synthetase LanM family protein [Scytonema sp. PMC 1069.18]MEC4882295.1 type 2 lanthipeptide synthetase LanM family protein [Scytonema sp. PMC 1070.18]
MDSHLQKPTWYQAVSLTERITLLQKTPRRSSVDCLSDNKLAEYRLQRWRSLSPFSTKFYFEHRLALDGITEDDFKLILSEPIEAVRDRFTVLPEWLVELNQAFSTYTSIDGPHHDCGQSNLNGAVFLELIQPLLNRGRYRLHQGIKALLQKYSSVPFAPDTVEQMLFTNVSKQLLELLEKTLVLELHVARLEGRLAGDTPQIRFQSFLRLLRERNTALRLLEQYPVLARQVIIRIKQSVQFVLEFLNHLCEDWEVIKAQFNRGEDPGILVNIDEGKGDRHRNGRSVLIANFRSGFKLVYKPRSLKIDIHFQELLTWCNNQRNDPPLRTLSILDRHTHGWVEFVDFQECSIVEEVQRFYQRQGIYLALLYVLGANDFHWENLIASGEYPMLVDLETLFQPKLKDEEENQYKLKPSEFIRSSVLSIGLLPERSWVNDESEGIDISGIGGIKSQLTSKPIPYWEKAGTDEMQLKRQRVSMMGRRNQPLLNGTEVNPLNYTEQIQAGFANMYRLLLKHRHKLLSIEGPLAQFAEDQIRFVFRPTRIYGILLRESFHPDVLHNALERDYLFDCLWKEVQHHPYLAKVIRAEREDLHKGDIPIFTTRPNSHDIWSSTDERITDLFEKSGMAVVHLRLQHLSEADLEKQLWFIRASLATLAMGKDQSSWTTYSLVEPQTVATHNQLLAASKMVGERLESLALLGDNDVTWIGLTLTAKDRWLLLPLGADLYSGIPGIAIFFAYLGMITSEERYTRRARTALKTMQRQVKESRSYITSISAFDGWAGVIYTLSHLGMLWNQPELFVEAENLVTLLPELIEQDEQLDIISGAAGCIGGLISLYQCVPSQRILAAAIQCGDRLIAKAQPMKHGIGWVNKNIGTKPLTGFSHGGAGIAWALLELAALTGKERFRTAAIQAINYERSLFCPKRGNWLDLRNFAAKVLEKKDKQNTCLTAWCHGAPGIGLSRLRGLSHLDDAEIRSEIDTALNTTMNYGFGSNHSLCHGDLGNLELLLQASLTLDDPQWKTQVDRFAAIILESIDKHGWLCGVPFGVETPGLMTGLAGIGYGLLRLADPERVPSVLVLEPPKLNSLVQKQIECAIATQ